MFEKAYQQALAATTFEIPEHMKFNFREIKNIYSQEIKFLPSTGQQEVHTGQNIMCEIPQNVAVDLNSFCMQYVG